MLSKLVQGLVLLTIFLGSLAGCSNPTETHNTITSRPTRLTDTAAWFIGSWQNINAKGTMFEHWQRTNDTLLSGSGGYIADGDTVFREQLELKQMGNDLYYIPVIEVQNNGKPVYFKLTKATPDMLVFEAPTHDWPQKIAYTKVTPDSIFAEVSGTQQGKMRLEAFPFSRVK